MQITPLNAIHRDAGAKLVDFAGWEMPLHYGSQIEEHHAVRRDAGMFDTSHMLAIDVAGSEADRLLRCALSNNVDKLRSPGQALYSCMLCEDGGVLDDLIVYFRHEKRFRVVVNAATADKDLRWLESQRAQRAPGVEIKPRRDLAMIAVQGPTARERVWAALPETRDASASLAPFVSVTAGPLFVARTGYTGEDGFELLVPASEAGQVWEKLGAQGVRPCGLAARDTLRLEAGMNLYGQDMDETVTPLESALAWTVELKDARDFVGKSALAGRPPLRQLVGLVLVERGGVLRAHQGVRTPHGEGEITSGTFSPTMQQSIALARVPTGVAPGDVVEVAVRAKHLRARVVKPPFVRNGKVLVDATG